MSSDENEVCEHPGKKVIMDRAEEIREFISEISCLYGLPIDINDPDHIIVAAYCVGVDRGLGPAGRPWTFDIGG